MDKVKLGIYKKPAKHLPNFSDLQAWKPPGKSCCKPKDFLIFKILFLLLFCEYLLQKSGSQSLEGRKGPKYMAGARSQAAQSWNIYSVWKQVLYFLKEL